MTNAVAGLGLAKNVGHRDAQGVRDRVQGADRRLALAGLDLGDEARRQRDRPGEAPEADSPPEPLRPDALADLENRSGHRRLLSPACYGVRPGLSRQGRPRRAPARGAARSRHTGTRERGRRWSGGRCRGAAPPGPGRTGTAATRRSPGLAPRRARSRTRSGRPTTTAGTHGSLLYQNIDSINSLPLRPTPSQVTRPGARECGGT